MNTLDSDLPTIGRAEWTIARISEAESPYYPLCESGPLCPLLDDDGLLYDFYVTGGLRHEIKRFCKTHHWEGKPRTLAMTDTAFKKLIRSMCNSFEARQALKASNDYIELHDAIWIWLKKTNKTLYDRAKSFGHQDKSGKLFMTSSELGRLLAEVGDEDLPSIRSSLIYLGLAFAMLDTKSRVELIAKIVALFPDTVDGLGLSAKPSDLPDHTSAPTPKSARKRSPSPKGQNG